MTHVLKSAPAVEKARDQAHQQLQAGNTAPFDFYQPHTNPKNDILLMIANSANHNVGNTGFIGGYIGRVSSTAICDTKSHITYYKTHFYAYNKTYADSGAGSGPSDRPVEQFWNWDEYYFPNGKPSDAPRDPSEGGVTSLPMPPTRRPTGGHSMCFPAGTLVSTSNGRVPIESLKEGESVLSYEIDLRRVVSTNITKVITTQRKDLIAIRSAGNSLLVSSNHCLIAADHQLVFASDLCNNKCDLLALASNGSVTTISSEEYDAHVAMQKASVVLYNLRLDGPPTYFVGDRGYLVEASD